MSKLKGLILTLLIFVSCSVFINCSAANVTKDSLRSAFETIFNGDDEENASAIVTDDEIKINIDNKEYVLKYNINEDNKITFSTDIVLSNNMTYSEFQDRQSEAVLPLWGPIVIAIINGVNFQNASVYYTFNYIAQASEYSQNAKYMVYNDIENGDVEVSFNTDKQIIYASQFEGRVLEYLYSLYETPQVFTDFIEDGIRSYRMQVSVSEIDANSVKMTSTATVDPNSANYGAINGLLEEMEDFIEDELGNIDIDFPSNVTPDSTVKGPDYEVTIKIGQNAVFKFDEKIEDITFNVGFVEYDKKDNYTCSFQGKSPGTIIGYITAGNTQKTISITVEESNAGKDDTDKIIEVKTKKTNSTVDNPKTGLSTPSLIKTITLIMTSILLLVFIHKKRVYMRL